MTIKKDATIRSTQAVFIVDDDPSICEGLCNLLESVGIRADAYSSAEAILKVGMIPIQGACYWMHGCPA